MRSTGGDHDRPMGVVTFLFTDVENSTDSWEADPAAMAAAMQRHHRIIDEVAATHGGIRAVEQGAGDSTVIAFGRSTPAVHAAIEIQRLLAAEPWDGTPVRVRMAVHTGEIDVAPDGTYQGPMLNRCGRLLSAAHGAQVVASAGTYELCRDALGDDVEFRSLGKHRFRGIDQPMLVFQVDAEGLEHTFPPLRTLDGTPHNLPTQFTNFVGRVEDRDAVAVLVEEQRLVTLTGAGGCGKTRLAVEVCAEIIGRFDDGIWFVDLAPLTGADAVGLALAAVLGVNVASGRRPIDAVVRWLDTQRCAVVLDNCEHLLEECAEVAGGIRAACPGVHVIATSREPLGVAGEVVWRIPSLQADEAFALFVDRARLGQSDYSPTPDDDRSIAAICERLDGIPLAIELAAARVRTMSLHDIASRLDDRFELLTGGGRVVLPRQRTLEASVAWSHQLLDDDERAVLRRLSVFSGGFTLEAAEQVVVGDSVEVRDVLRLVTHLVDKSLVSVVADEGGRTRYGMLETVRQFGRERLIDDEGIEDVRDRHLAWFVEWSETAGGELEGPRTVEFLRQIEPEADNLQAALRWAERRGDWDSMARILGSLVWFWLWRVQLRITWEWLDRLDPHLDELTAESRIRALWCRLWMSAHYLGRHDVIDGAHRALLDAARGEGDSRYEARALAIWGTHTAFFDSESAEAIIEEAVGLARQAGDAYIECYALSALALLDVFPQRARPALDRLARIASQVHATGSPQLMAEHRSWQCTAEWQAGELLAARRSVEEVVSVYSSISDINIVGIALETELWLDLYEGRPSRSRAEELLLRYVRAEEYQHVPMAAALVATIRAYEGAFTEADALLEQIWELEAVRDAPAVGLWVASGRIAVAVMGGALDEGMARAIEARGAAIDFGNVACAAVADAWIGVIGRLEGRHVDAVESLHAALDVLQREGLLLDLTWVLEEIAGLAADASQHERAARLFAAADRYRSDQRALVSVHRGDARDADIEATRAALGRESFDRAWTEGHSMSLNAAVEFATRTRGDRGRPALGWDSLTPTESNVAELVVEGLTNREIGERLLMGAETVKTHLSNVYRKLEVRGRTELAVAAAQRVGMARDEARLAPPWPTP